MNFPQLLECLKSEASRAGLEVRDCGNGHLRIEGGLFAVNWYPFSKKRTLWLNGQNDRAAISCENPAQAVAMALRGPKKIQNGSRDWRKSGYSRIKRRLWKKDPRCCYCLKPMAFEETTVEHVMPLSLGGADADYNRKIAHAACNAGRNAEVLEARR